MKGIFNGEHVLITGAAGRLGRVVASTFKEAGASVIGVDSNPSESSLPTCHGADLTDESSVIGLFRQLEIDGVIPRAVIHTVGMWDGRSFDETEFERWKLVLDVNLTSTFLVFREAIRFHQRLAIEDSLRLVAFSSGQGADRGRAQQAAYSASKAGVMRLVEAVAEEHPDDGITAHAIAPSMILFDGMEKEKGIPATDLANLCVLLAGPAGEPLNGSLVRAYGTLS